MVYGLYNPAIEQKTPKFWLAKPNREIIARLKEIDTVANLKVEFGKVNQVDFTIPFKKEKGNATITNPNLAKIRAKYLLKMEFMNTTEWFVIEQFSKEAEQVDSIPVTAYSLQQELAFKKIYEIEETSLIPNQILTKVLENTSWSVGTIDIILASKYRSFNFSNTSVLDCLYQIATTYNGILQFDTVNETIGLMDESTISKFDGLMLNDKNYIESLSDQKNASDIVTRLYPIGSEGLTINSVNPTGSSYIENFSHFLYPFQRNPITKEKINSSFYMSDELAHAMLDYQELLESKDEILKNLMAQRVTYETELVILKNTQFGIQQRLDAINDLTDVMKSNREYTAKSTVNGLYETIDIREGDYFIQMRAKTGTAKLWLDNVEYNLTSSWTSMQKNYPVDKKVKLEISNVTGTGVEFYLARIPLEEKTWTNTQLQTRYNAFIIVQELTGHNVTIFNKETQITNVNSQIQVEYDAISLQNNFTEELLAERERYIFEEYWIEDDHVNPKELYDDAVEKFKTINKPSTVMDVSIVNFLIMAGEIRNWDKLKIGSKLRVKHSKLDIESESILIGIDYDFSSQSIDLSISDTKDLMSDDEKLVQMIYSTSSSANSLALKKFIYDDAARKANAVSDLLNETWDATQRRIVAGTNESVEIGKRGIIVRNPNYPDDILIMQAGVVAISNDNGMSFKNALTTQGLVAERILGQIIIGERVWIEDDNGVVTIKGDQIEIKDAFSQPRVTLGQYETGKFGARFQNGAIEIVGGLPKEQIDPNALLTVEGSLSEKIGGMNTLLNTFRADLNEAFLDEIVSESDRAVVNRGIESITFEKSIIDAKLNTLMNNPNIATSIKDNLIQSKTSVGVPVGYDLRHQQLINRLNIIIADNAVSQFEKDDLTLAFTNYDASLVVLAQYAEQAENALSDGAAKKLREDLRMTAPLPTSLKMDENGFTAYQVDTTKFARMDYRGLYIQGGAIDIRTEAASNRGVVFNGSGIAGYNSFGIKTFELTNDGKLTLKGGSLTIEGGIGTHITSDGIYTGSMNILQINGTGKMIYFGSSAANFDGRIDYVDGAIRFQRDSSTYYKVNPGGTSGYESSSSSASPSPAAIHQFYAGGSPIFNFGLIEPEFNHRSLQSGKIRIKFLNGDVEALQIKSLADTQYRPIEASEFTVSSLRSLKKNIVPYDGDALTSLLSTDVYRYNMADESDSELKRIGLIYDEVPADMASVSGSGVDIYSMCTVNWRALQQFHEKYEAKIFELEERLALLER